MRSTFRVAIGPCSFRDPDVSRRKRYQEVCDLVEASLSRLRDLDPAKLRALPSLQEQSLWLTGDWTDVVTVRERLDDQGDLIVVQAFRPTWRRPNYISLTGIGHLVADGILLTPDDQVQEAPDELLWAFR